MSEWDGVDPDNTRVLGASTLLDGRAGRGGDEGGFEDTGSFEPQMQLEHLASRDQESLAFFQVSAISWVGHKGFSRIERPALLLLLNCRRSVGYDIVFIGVCLIFYEFSSWQYFLGEPIATMHRARRTVPTLIFP